MSTLSILADNIRYLRMQQTPELTQSKIAEHLKVTRESYAKYETAKSAPPLDVLLAISRYYHISADLLLTVDLRKYPMEELLKLPDNRIILPIKTDHRGENKIEVVPYKASMGYLAGHADPEYIDSLQTMSLPFLHNGKYRAFPVEGDSMPPYKDGTYIIGKYVESITDMKTGKTYLLMTRTGFVFKRLDKINQNSITVKSDNTFYDNYDILFTDLREAWQYAGSFSSQEQEIIDFSNEDVKGMLLTLMNEIKDLKNKLS
ncbi:XRE family transcriptional regulator [Chryseobacterium gallinarum]|uniref:XRE family transcriptional regulator n=1 Tax=Chryseobacterium gallinarum TaxID=1324352 RepID=A0A0G3M2R8_CHRGL|nr:LexA family transcriptional regulator [Chryseobacterium gallinarum]AKK71312.1 XRE family transcriptional regulator [Chryseobacterium gallinarum]